MPETQETIESQPNNIDIRVPETPEILVAAGTHEIFPINAMTAIQALTDRVDELQRALDTTNGNTIF